MRQKLIFKLHLASLCISDLGQLEKGVTQESRKTYDVLRQLLQNKFAFVR